MKLFSSWVEGGPSSGRHVHAMKVLRTKDDNKYMAYLLCEERFFYWSNSTNYKDRNSFYCDMEADFTGLGPDDCLLCKKLLGL